jgi:hypothetical protein
LPKSLAEDFRDQTGECSVEKTVRRFCSSSNFQDAEIEDPSCGNWSTGDAPTIDVDFLLTNRCFKVIKATARDQMLTKPAKNLGTFCGYSLSRCKKIT